MIKNRLKSPNLPTAPIRLGERLGNGYVFRARGGAAGQGEHHNFLIRSKKGLILPLATLLNIRLEIGIIRQRQTLSVFRVIGDTRKIMLTAEVAGLIGPENIKQQVLLNILASGQLLLEPFEQASGMLPRQVSDHS